MPACSLCIVTPSVAGPEHKTVKPSEQNLIVCWPVVCVHLLRGEGGEGGGGEMGGDLEKRTTMVV